MRESVFEIVNKEGSSKHGDVMKVSNGYYSTVDLEDITYSSVRDLIENLPESMKLIDDEGNDIDMNKELISELVEIEMNTGSHEDYLEDYETPLAFYLSNVEDDSYIGYLTSNYNLTEEEAHEMQSDVIRAIEDKME